MDTCYDGNYINYIIFFNVKKTHDELDLFSSSTKYNKDKLSIEVIGKLGKKKTDRHKDKYKYRLSDSLKINI